MSTVYLLTRNYDSRRKRAISNAAYQVLRHANGERTIRQIMTDTGLDASLQQSVVTELRGLWSERYIVLKPAHS